MAAKILVAADAQKLFFPVTESVLNSQDVWASPANPKPELTWGLLRSTGLDIFKAQADVTSTNVQSVIDQHLMDAKALEVTKIPRFFASGKLLVDFGGRFAPSQ